MNGFEADCHQLSEQLTELQKSYERLQSENAALELSLRETKSTTSGREEHTGQAASSQPTAEPSNRPVRPTPKGWVRLCLIA